jgi:chromatin structure-remodeling complex subunit RSC9
MAPVMPSEAETEEFLAKLAAYHEKRGTLFDPRPRVGNKNINLLALFNVVNGHGGYDKVSDEKLLWRKLGQEFNLGTANAPAAAFALKSAYYKYLAAYEISTIHGKEPPPKEILEDVTAKGSGLLLRTMENFRPPTRRETGALGTADTDGSGDDGTPARDRAGSEDTPGSGGRVTRGLRQAPPQRVLFQPDLPRQTRHASTAASNTPQVPRGASTSYNPTSNPDGMSVAVANYEPRPQMPLTLRPVITPGNNPSEFARRQRLLREQAANNGRQFVPQNTKMMLPGTGFEGPNIYVRCLMALKSGIPAEQDYALHHLVKISMERGDKYRFESFPGLAEALVEKVLEVSSLFYQVHWSISFRDDGSMHSTHTLDGLEGTTDILQRIDSLIRKPTDDNIHAAEFSDRLLMINEAALTLRNMVMLEENAFYVSELYPLRDFISIALNLPELESVVELKHYALDIAEQLTKYLFFEAHDPLYLSLLAQLRSSDRGAILTSLRAISRISMNLEENNTLRGVPTEVVHNILNWTLLEDEELVNASLDFLYQYTAVVDNVDAMITELPLEPLVNQLTRLLAYGEKTVVQPLVVKSEFRHAPSDIIPPLPQDLLQQLLKLEEPERSSQWLRCLFEEDKESFITQINLWQAYQARFSGVISESGRPLLPAAEFIKNVSTTFGDKANAQIQSGPVQKFIIKGIRIRRVPVDFTGKEYTACQWTVNTKGAAAINGVCGEFFMGPQAMYDHILTAHLGAQKNEEGKFSNAGDNNYACAWKKCYKYPKPTPMKLSQIASHISLHIPSDTRAAHSSPYSTSVKPTPSWVESAVVNSYTFHDTAKDERHEAAGIPLTAVLVLRNLARNIPKTEAEENAMKDEGAVSWLDRLFKPVEAKLWEVFAHNRPLVRS